MPLSPFLARYDSTKPQLVSTVNAMLQAYHSPPMIALEYALVSHDAT